MTLADFLKFATAAEAGFGFPDGSVIEAINKRQHEARLDSIDVDPVAPRVIDRLEQEGRVLLRPIEGTATEIWHMLTLEFGKPLNWPRTASHFSQHLSRITPDLRSVGITVERRPRSSDKKVIVISKESGSRFVHVGEE